MNTRHLRRVAVAVSAAALLPLALTACSGDSDTSASGSGADKAASSDTKPYTALRTLPAAHKSPMSGPP